MTHRRATGAVWLAAFIAAIAILSGVKSRAAEVPIPASPTTWVTDNAGLLTPSTRDSLDSRLAAYNRSTGHQVIVWIGTTTGDTPLEDWTIHAFTAWKVGRKGLDDGLALFLFTADRKARIEVGYGLEPVVTDAIASEIIRNDIVPNMRQGDGDAAVTSAVSALLSTIGGENGAAPQPPPTVGFDAGDVMLFIFGVILFLVIISAIARAVSGNRYYSIGSGPVFWGGGWGGGGWGGSGGGGGGGFSGGGGMGGGGGASGGW